MAYPRLGAVLCVLLLVQPALGLTRAQRRELRAAEAKRRAQNAPPLTVIVLGDEGRSLHVSLKSEDLGSNAPTARCDTPCVVTVTTGRYRIGVDATEKTFDGSRVVTLDGTSRTVVVSPRPHAMRTVGLAVGLLGTGMIAGGVAIGAAYKPARPLCSENTPCPVDDRLFWTAVSFTLAGLAMTPIGWTLFGRSYVPGVVVTSPVTKPGVAGLLGIVPLRGGMAISGVLTF